MGTIKAFLATLLLFFFSCYSYGQTYDEQKDQIVWRLGPADPRIQIMYGSRGIYYGVEQTGGIIKNNFQEELRIKVRYTVKDFCGGSKVFEIYERTLKSHETYVQSGYNSSSYSTPCKEFAEYGSAKKVKTKIRDITFEVLLLKDLTAERKKSEEALRQAEEAESARRLAEAREARAAEIEKSRKAKEAQAERVQKVRDAKAADAEWQEAERSKGSGEGRAATASTSGSFRSTTSTTTNTSTLTADNVGDYIYAQEQAKLRAQEEEKARKQEAYEAQMAEFKRIEEAQVAEAKRIENLAERHIQHANDADNFGDKAWQVEQAQRLESNHNDIARMEREYEQKLADLDVAMNELEAARRQEWSSRVKTGDWKDASGNADPALGELVEATGAVVNMLGEESRKRQAKEALDRERANFLARVEAEKAKMRFDLRHNMMRKEFPALRMPTGKEGTPKSFYGFYIFFNKEDLGALKSKVVVSDVIEIGTYADGTWPSPLFLTVADRETKARFDQYYFHTKKYASYEEAVQIQKAFRDFFSRDGVVTVTRLETHLNPGDARMDFWETKVESR